MATEDDIQFARGVVRDSLVILRWAASNAGVDEEGVDVVPAALKPALAEAVEEVSDGPFQLAMITFDDQNPEFPRYRLGEVLDAVGWSGAQRRFKEQALEEAGREEVVGAAEGGPQPRGRIWKRFLKVLDAALQSLSALPGVEAVAELKDFVEASRAE